MCPHYPRFLAVLGALAATAMAPLHGQAAIADPVADIQPSALTVQLDSWVDIPSTGSNPVTRLAVLKEVPDGSDRLMINDLRGQLWVIDRGVVSLFMDLGALLSDFRDSPGLGTGFNSFAFHPEFADNGLFYTAHNERLRGTPDLQAPVAVPLDLHGVITEWTVDSTAANTFSGQRRELLRIALHDTIHGVQEIAFNPLAVTGSEDYGLLYIGVGDAGSYINGRPENTQRLDSPYGTVLRIDPAGSDGASGNYGIPPTNPWAGDSDPSTLGEIYAYGFRNPHRFAWDPATGALFSGDIGEKNIEELNRVEAGLDYGWPQREGTFLFDPQSNGNVVFSLPTQDTGFTYPVAQYDHDDGFAIVSGHVYRGQRVPALDGQLISADISNGRVFVVGADALTQGTTQPFEELQLRDAQGQPTTLLAEVAESRADPRFGQDLDGEIYLFTKRDGTIRYLSSVGASGPFGPPFFWKADTWMGVLNDRDWPMIEHAEHGAFFAEGSADSLWFLDPALGWLWTREGLYPLLYSAEQGTWLNYGEATLEPRYFFDLSAGSWSTEAALNEAP